MRWRWLFWVWFSLFFGCAYLLLSSTLPARVDHLQMPAIQVPEAVEALGMPYRIRLDVPHALRAGDEAQIQLTLEPLDGIPPETNSSTSRIVAVAQLALPGGGAWAEEVREPMRAGGAPRFVWALHPYSATPISGVLWLHLDLLPENDGTIQRITLLARPIQLDVHTVLGVSAPTARAIGMVGCVALFLLAAATLFPLRDDPSV